MFLSAKHRDKFSSTEKVRAYFRKRARFPSLADFKIINKLFQNNCCHNTEINDEHPQQLIKLCPLARVSACKPKNEDLETIHQTASLTAAHLDWSGPW